MLGSERRQRSGRGRSRSPINIDRYQPDRGRDDYYNRREDFRRRTPPTSQGSIDRYVPGQDPAPPILLTNPLPNPLTLDYQVGFNWFAEWWRMEQMVKDERERQKSGGRRVDRLKGEKEARDERGKEREQIQAAYDNYKEKLQMQMAKNFVQQHKGDVWFKEKYDPELRREFRQRLANFRQSTYSQWSKDLAMGVFDEFTLEGIYKSDSNGAGGVVEKEEGEATAANEVLGVGDLVPLRGGDLRDESAFMPTLLIKTIAPTVSREKMETFCKEHLGETEGGFRWLSLSDPNPQKKCHRIGWVLLNPSDSVDIRRGSRGDDDEAEVDGIQPDNSKVVADKAASELNGKTIQDAERGDFTCHVGIHEPPSAPRKKALWDLFSAPERIERDLQLVTRLTLKLEEEMDEIISATVRVDEKVEDLRNSGRLQPAGPLMKNGKNENGVENGEDQPMKENGEEGDEGKDGEEEEEEEEEEEGAYDDDEEDDEELLAKKKKLDLLVEYLRRVYNFCFFCVFESDSVHELVRKCPGGHLRRPRSSLTTSAKTVARASAIGEAFPVKKQEASANGEAQSPMDEKKSLKAGSKTQQQLQRAFNWVKTYEEKLFQILDPDSVDLKKIGGRPLEEALEEELKKFVKQEDEAKFRCKVPECTKLFKGPHFWRKHVEKRHNEFFERLKQDVSNFRRFNNMLLTFPDQTCKYICPRSFTYCAFPKRCQ